MPRASAARSIFELRWLMSITLRTFMKRNILAVFSRGRPVEPPVGSRRLTYRSPPSLDGREGTPEKRGTGGI